MGQICRQNRSRQNRVDLSRIQERWVNFCHSTESGKKVKWKTVWSSQCGKRGGVCAGSSWRQKVQKQKNARVFIPFRTTGARPCFVPTVTYIWNWPLSLVKVKHGFADCRFIVSNYSHSSFNETHIVIRLGWQPLQIEISLRSRVSPTARNFT